MSKLLRKSKREKDYNSVLKRIEQLHVKRRKAEDERREFKRLEQIRRICEESNKKDTKEASELAFLHEFIKRAEELGEKEQNPHAKATVEACQKAIDFWDETVSPAVEAHMKASTKHNCSNSALRTYRDQDYSTRYQMRPEATGDEEFQELLILQNEASCKLRSKTAKTSSKSLQEFSYLVADCARSDYQFNLERINILIEETLWLNEDLIMKELYPQTDLLEHYVNRKLKDTKYLKGSNTVAIGSWMPIGEWNH